MPGKLAQSDAKRSQQAIARQAAQRLIGEVQRLPDDLKFLAEQFAGIARGLAAQVAFDESGAALSETSPPSKRGRVPRLASTFPVALEAQAGSCVARPGLLGRRASRSGDA